MEQKILGISGAKQSGKTTSSNFLHGYQLRFYDVVEKFMMDDEGNLLVNTVGIDEKGAETEGMGIMDVERQDDDFCEFASAYIWPHVRSFSFADPLKSIAIQLFGLTRDQCFGTDEDKNTPTDIIWKDMPGKSRSKKKMTAREFLQSFGTDVCRKIKPDVWTSSCIDRVQTSQTELAIIPDCRFPNEVEAIKEAGGKVIRLTKSRHDDSHLSETALTDSYEGFDVVIDNKKLDLHESNMALMNVLKEWGWLKVKAG